MDVGFNNQNTLGQFAPEFTDVVFFVQATSDEQFCAWQDWSKESMSNIDPLSDKSIGILELWGYTAGIPEHVIEEIKNLNNKVKRNQHPRVDWKQINMGFSMILGNIDERPVNVSFSFAQINGKKICFYDCVSQVADHKMIEDWLTKHFQLTHDGYSRWNHVNATNIHNCINSLDRLDVEPRDTIYKGN